MFDMRDFLKRHMLVVKIGAITGLFIILFEIINLFVVYRYVKLDYYLTVVAVFFLITGLLINKRYRRAEMIKQASNDLLTAKEMQIFQLVGEGKTNKEIATTHFIEVSTVKTHINNIYSKLSLNNRKEARAKYAEIREKRIVI